MRWICISTLRAWSSCRQMLAVSASACVLMLRNPLHCRLLLLCVLHCLAVMPSCLLRVPHTAMVGIKPSACVACTCYLQVFVLLLALLIGLLPKCSVLVVYVCWSSPGCFQDHCSATMKSSMVDCWSQLCCKALCCTHFCPLAIMLSPRRLCWGGCWEGCSLPDR